LPVVMRQAEAALAKLRELEPQVTPAKAEAEAARAQTVEAREQLKRATDRVVAEIGASRGLDAAERKRDEAAARRDALRTKLLADAADDPRRKALALAVDEARAKLDAVKADANAGTDQRLAAVANLGAAESQLTDHERTILAASEPYRAAAAEADTAAAEATTLRAAVLRDAKQDERIKTAEQALRDAQRVTAAANQKATTLETAFRTHRGRYTSAAAEQARLESDIAGARRELGIGVLP
jgi:hypothetical protein